MHEINIEEWQPILLIMKFSSGNVWKENFTVLVFYNIIDQQVLIKYFFNIIDQIIIKNYLR